jgi:DNA-binding NarL/FixJ family response regulator
MIKLGIVDDNPQVLEDFATYFNGKSYVSELITFSSPHLVKKYVESKQRIDYLFLDYATSAPSCLPFIGQIKSISRHTEIIVLSNNYSRDCVIRAFVAGASGFLPKNLPLEEVEDHLRNIIKGGAAITPQIAKELITYFNPGPRKLSNTTLNEKEHKIIRLMADGHDYKEIAKLMDVSGHSVRYYMKQIYKKMNVKSKGEAIKKYMMNNKF